MPVWRHPIITLGSRDAIGKTHGRCPNAVVLVFVKLNLFPRRRVGHCPKYLEGYLPLQQKNERATGGRFPAGKVQE
jgi:hypothetical protein